MTDIINTQNGKVQVIFERTDGARVYRDALWFSTEEYANILPEQIAAMQTERFDNWLAIINTMPTEEILTTEPEVIVSSQE